MASLKTRAATPTATDAKSSVTTPVRQHAAPAESDPPRLPRESRAPANPGPDDGEALDRIHKRAHELASSNPAEAEPLFRRRSKATAGCRDRTGP